MRKRRWWRAIDVVPEHGRQGVGGMIRRELETCARRQSLTELALEASANAEAFYRRHGFHVEGCGEHVLRTGSRLASVRTRELLKNP